MRFNNIEKFEIKDLLLDKGNYRFLSAKDQKACIKNIYYANTQYFKGLMQSIAEDDLGELILVYRKNEDNIVLDGNRRVSALKVLYNNENAPTDALKIFAEDLCSKNKIKFTGIQAQVSEDKRKILNTVYERHAAAKSGKARINWSAYAAARFRYDQKTDDSEEWYITALVMETGSKFPDVSDFLDGTSFSFEVFRRLIKAAFNYGIISKLIFSDRDKRIKKTDPNGLRKDAIAKAHKFLVSMQNKEITLSRKDGTYADKDKVSEYIRGFSLSPDNQKLEESKNGTTADTKPSDQSGNDTEGTTETSADNEQGTNRTAGSQKANKQSYGITRSDKVVEKLKKLNSMKLNQLYKSLCTVSLNEHPQLMYVGAWSFFESLAARAGKTDPKVEFVGFFRSETNNQTTIKKAILKDCWVSLGEISKKGNANKHSGVYASTNASQLRADFNVLEPFIIEVLDKLINIGNIV